MILANSFIHNPDLFEQVLGPLQKLINQHAQEEKEKASKRLQDQQAAGLAAATRASFRLRHLVAAGIDASGMNRRPSLPQLVTGSSAAPGGAAGLSGSYFLATLKERENEKGGGAAGVGASDYTLRIEGKGRVMDNGLASDVMAEFDLLRQLSLRNQSQAIT